MRRRRTSPLILQKSFEDKTEAIRKEYESMANVFALAKEENDRLLFRNQELRSANNSLLDNISRLTKLIKEEESNLEVLKNQSSVEQVKINTLEGELVERDKHLNNLDKNI